MLEIRVFASSAADSDDDLLLQALEDSLSAEDDRARAEQNPPHVERSVQVPAHELAHA